MKRIQSLIVCFLLLWLWLPAPAQIKLIEYEYWFNHSYNSKQQVSITNGAEHHFTETIDVSALPDGVNVLNIRVRDENKLQSSTLSKVFYKMPNTQLPEKNLSTYEFWFNHDYENNQLNTIRSGSETHIFTQIDISDLPDGVNVLNIRCSDENNLYSSTLSKVFYKIPQTQLIDKNLTTYELWFNNDYENRQENSLVAHTNHHILAEIDVSDLPAGVHVVNIRVKDENKFYSSTLSKAFYKIEQDFFAETTLSGYKYWFDEDYENAVFFQFHTPVKQFSILDDFDATHLPVGEHTVHFQFLDEKGKWSVIKSDVFTKTAIPKAIFSVDNEIACANSPVFFLNESIEADSFLWDFGDGNSSGEFEPEHIYAEVGEYQVVLTAIDLDSGRENETSQLITVEDCSEICINLQFNPGWQIFSAPVTPDSADMKFLFQPLIDNSTLVKIHDEEGKAVEDYGFLGGWKNFIGDISPGEGYKLRVNSKDSLEVCGAIVDYPYSISLKAGWNIIGFPQTSAVDAMDVVQSLIDKENLEKVQDEEGAAIEDWGFLGGWKNNIGEFSPGKGFKIKLAAADTILIQEVYEKSVSILPKPVPTTHFNLAFSGNGVDHMNINIAQLPKDFFQPGDELAVFDGDLCVGAVTLMPHHFIEQIVPLAASAEDQYGMPGFKEGNPFTLKLWSSLQNKEIELNPEILKGSSTFVKHESTLLSLGKYAATGLDGELFSGKTEIKCYPNPFSHEITIEIMLHKEEEIQLEIFNQMGQRIKTLSSKQLLPAGSFRFNWNGRNYSKQKVTSGIYYVKFSTGAIQKFQKIIMSDR